MIVRAIDVNNDWTFGKGQNNYVSNNAAIAQNIKTELQSFLGDCFFALSDGLDWFNLLGSKNVVALQLGVRAAILNVTGVTSIVSLTIDLDTVSRRIEMQCSVDTIYSAVNNNNAPVISNTSFLLTESGDILTTEDGAGLLAQ